MCRKINGTGLQTRRPRKTKRTAASLLLCKNKEMLWFVFFLRFFLPVRILKPAKLTSTGHIEDGANEQYMELDDSDVDFIQGLLSSDDEDDSIELVEVPQPIKPKKKN